jgi:hypothetical protein
MTLTKENRMIKPAGNYHPVTMPLQIGQSRQCQIADVVADRNTESQANAEKRSQTQYRQQAGDRKVDCNVSRGATLNIFHSGKV